MVVVFKPEINKQHKFAVTVPASNGAGKQRMVMVEKMKQENAEFCLDYPTLIMSHRPLLPPYFLL